MSQYGCTLTKDGLALIAKVLAGATPLVLTRVMMGSGQCPDDTYPGDLTDWVEPVAAGTSTEPIYDKDSVRMTIEYRSDLNGGLEHGFYIREFGVFAQDVDKSEVMLFYGTLGDYPQYVSAYTATGLDVRRYPVVITVGEGAEVHIDYVPEAFMTAEDMEDYCTTVILPQFIVQLRDLIEEHNADPAAHPDIRAICAGLDSRLALLELMYSTDVSGNPFVVTFESLNGVHAAGVWNQPQKRMEF